MRLLLVSHVPNNPDGGSSRVYHLLREGLEARGHQVTLLHYEDFGVPQRMHKWVHRFGFPQAASRRAAREPLEGFDVIMSSSGMLYPLFQRLHARPRRPLLVHHLHGLNFFEDRVRFDEAERGHMSLSWSYRHITRHLPIRWDLAAARFADLTVVQNGRDRDFIEEHGVAPVELIPLPVHPAIAAAGRTAPPPEERDPHALLWFGSWVERKGCFYLPRAFERIAERFPQATLTLGGTHLPAETLLAGFAPALRPRITVLPQITLADQLEQYRRHALFLFPSLSEGFGFALLEAMAMGLAAVTTHAGLAADWLHDRETARIVPPASALHLAEGACTLMADRELRCRVARNGQALALTFTQERFVSAYETAFLEHLRRR